MLRHPKTGWRTRFAAPPSVPAPWGDAMCRSLGENIYTGCWENEYRVLNPEMGAATALVKDDESELEGTGGELKRMRVSAEEPVSAGEEAQAHPGGFLRMKFPTNPAHSGRVGEEAAVDSLLMLQHCHASVEIESSGVSEYHSALQTLSKMVLNLIRITDVTPEQKKKFRRVNVSNPAFFSRIGRLVGGIEFFLALGFQYVYQDAAECGNVSSGACELVLHPAAEDTRMIERVYKHIESVLKTFSTGKM